MDHHHHCHEHATPSLISLIDFSEFGDVNVIITLLVTAIIGSFSHCMGMCGPISAMLSSVKLSQVPADKLSNSLRLRASLNLYYIFGKAITYGIMGGLSYFIASELKQLIIFKWVAFLVLSLAALTFLISGLSQIRLFIKFDVLNPNNLMKRFAEFYNTHINKYLKQGNQPQFIQGLVLGLIPCGFVYASLVSAVSLSLNMVIASLAMFVFGLGTSPGLIMAGLFGSYAIAKYKKAFRFLFLTLMLFNSFIVFGYALKMI